jgi:glutathione S-transferase
MKLIGMFDSPFVRRVAISLNRLELPFEHADWSVGRDLERILEFSPLGRVPVLVLDDGEVLIESSVILDFLDEFVGPARALMPTAGAPRRHALKLIALAIGAAEKGRELVYERVMRPAEKRHEPWVARCRAQMHGALGELETECRERGSGRWLVGDRLTQADITATCAFTFLTESGVGNEGGETARYPALTGLVARCEALPEFVAVRAPWFAPTV